ncbi:NUDIX hydrolase [Vibrio nitrifigilis]|uniref:8-oxo-dGTP diphosphatase n=1 Tax=Vibrio nitrifigilis TaxID=2789781 RepID=A0ABS0GJ95_9VIBR|nr:NUDIX domain-containing protein [Vibrio nitrifigilis]MBF9002536.1 NUDIX domain-containing protein [Vibrio nitrifigilis]
MTEHACVSFMLIKDGEILVEQRSMTKEHDAGLIAIPGGHMEPGENPEQTLVREMAEELEVTPTDYRYLCTLYHLTTETQKIHYYVINSWEGTISAQEADEVYWRELSTANLDIGSDRSAVNEYFRVIKTQPDFFVA